MWRMSGRPGFAPALWSLVLLVCSPGIPAAAPLPPVVESVLARADSLAGLGRVAAGSRLLDSLEASAIARGDSRARDAALLSRARAAVATRKLDETERILAILIPRLSATRDPLLWIRAMRVEGRRLALRGRDREAASAYRAAIRTARRSGLRVEQAQAEMSAAGWAVESAHHDEAVAGFRRALLAIGEDGEPRTRLQARAGLARSLQSSGRFDEARREHALTIELATRLGNRPQLADTEYNLGVLEHRAGDLSRAERHYLAALGIQRELGWVDRSLASANSLAILRLNAGRIVEAESILAVALPLSTRPEVSADRRARLLCQMGILRREQGSIEEGIAWGRRAVAASESLLIETALDVTVPLVATLGEAGRGAEAMALLDDQLRRLHGRLTPKARGEWTLERARLALRLGRPLEAIVPLREAIPRVMPLGVEGYDAIALQSDLAWAYGALGRRDSSLLWHRRASDSWEVWRRGTRDVVWHERYDDAALRFATRHAAALLADESGAGASPRAAAAAFAVLQPHRARSLAERLQRREGSDPALSSRTGADALRRQVLRAGELFLDIHAAPETTIVIALSRDTILAWGAPPRGPLERRLGRLRDLLADPNSSAAIREQAAAALGNDLFGPGAGLVLRARAVLVAAGALSQFPLGLLTTPGVRAPLGGRLSYAPSATLLGFARSRATASGGGLLAIARTRDEQGRELRGAGEEARWLASRFEGAEAWVDDDRIQPSGLGPRIARAQVLHFAAHARDDAKRPWRNGLLLGRPGTPDAWLEAWDVARLRPGARLCVLTGCGSIGGRGDSGETLEGLASAWLAAGIPTAVASQWEVDDASATAFVRQFYEALARGQAVGAALQVAQERMRANPATAAPTHWAGFVVLGDPTTRVRLRSR